MITMGIGLVAGVFYWLASYKLAFWILIYAIIYGGLGILRSDQPMSVGFCVSTKPFSSSVMIRRP